MNMQSLLKQAQKMQKELAKAEELNIPVISKEDFLKMIEGQE